MRVVFRLTLLPERFPQAGGVLWAEIAAADFGGAEPLPAGSIDKGADPLPQPRAGGRELLQEAVASAGAGFSL